ncbi:hypothetical protein K7711_46465 [Nocardia sp. CA2R105]|uniref:hypothetical protein n=1 Tax=Nocardia coffeae TaxID=2873381 RepID=UPI001CA7A49F|nr:hypothetical protein [Nocardia coffeae]MBY8863977.1 hypothetical protein [Nocardia coffeae]
MAAAFCATRNSDVSDDLATGSPIGITVQTKDTLDDNGAWWFPSKLVTSGSTISETQLSQIMSAGL